MGGVSYFYELKLCEVHSFVEKRLCDLTLQTKKFEKTMKKFSKRLDITAFRCYNHGVDMYVLMGELCALMGVTNIF